MAQYVSKADLKPKGIVPLSRASQITAIAGRYDIQRPNSITASAEDLADTGKPEIYYMHNVLPTADGVKAIGWQQLTGPAVSSSSTTDETITWTGNATTTANSASKPTGAAAWDTYTYSGYVDSSVSMVKQFRVTVPKASGNSFSFGIASDFGNTLPYKLPTDPTAYILGLVFTGSAGSPTIITQYVNGATTTTFTFDPAYPDFVIQIDFANSRATLFNDLQGPISGAGYMYDMAIAATDYRLGIAINTPGTSLTAIHTYYYVDASTYLTLLQVEEIRDDAGNYGYVALDTSGKLYFLGANSTSATWMDMGVIASDISNTTISTAYVSGVTYIHLRRQTTYVIDLAAATIAEQTFTGITIAAMVCCVAAVNYLIFTDGTRVYWSSVASALDFAPSLSTGAGSDIPADLSGQVICMRQIATGFALYTINNIVLSTYSNNTSYPWIYRPMYGSAGVISARVVSPTGDEASNYAMTKAGIMKVAATGAGLVFPDISDFLAGKLIESYTPSTATFAAQPLGAGDFNIAISFASSRYLFISYGANSAGTYTHAWVYDTLLKRWGKILKEHIAVIHYHLAASFSDPNYSGTPYYHTFAIVDQFGVISAAVPSYLDENANGCIVVGKYALTREAIISIQEVLATNTAGESTILSCTVLTSFEGKEADMATQLPLIKSAGSQRRWGSRATGRTHSFAITGAFDLTDLLIRFSEEGFK